MGFRLGLQLCGALVEKTGGSIFPHGLDKSLWTRFQEAQEEAKRVAGAGKNVTDNHVVTLMTKVDTNGAS